MRDEAKQLSPSEIRKMAAEHYTTEEKVRDHLERVFDKMLKAVKPKSREAIFLQDQYDKMSKLWDAALEKTVENTRAAEQTQAMEEARQQSVIQLSDGVQYSKRGDKKTVRIKQQIQAHAEKLNEKSVVASVNVSDMPTNDI